MADTLAVESNTLDHKCGNSDRQAAAEFGARLRARGSEINKNSAEIGRLAGIKKQSMAGYWNGERLCGSDKLFALADTLRVRGRWLISGEGPKLLDNPLIDAAQADFVGLPRYDLRHLSDDGKGRRSETVPFRRDWLSRRLFTSTGLWLTDVPSDYDDLGMAEGDIVVCSDVDDAGPQENWICFFRDEYGFFAARYGHGSQSDGWRSGGVSARDIAEKRVFIVARIHAKVLTRLS